MWVEKMLQLLRGDDSGRKDVFKKKYASWVEDP